MKKSQYIIKIVPVAVIVLVLSVNTALSQSTNISYGNSEKFFISLSLNPNMTGISASNDSLKSLKTASKNSIGFTLEAGYMFSKYLGVSLGAGLLNCSSELQLDSYKQWFGDIDTEGDPYNKRVTGTGIKEVQKISFLSIPVKLNINIPLGEKFGLFVNPGVNLMFPVSKKYSGSGRFSYAGYYPAYDVLITDVANEGFLADQSNSVTGTTNLKSFIPAMSVNAGLNYRVNEKIKIAVGLAYFRTLSEISASVPYTIFHLSEEINKMSSMMAVSKSTFASGTGISIGISYSIK